MQATVPISEELFRALVGAAVLAPSGHNTQPWRFALDRDTIRIRPDPTRRLPVVDPDDHALYISLGCALENLSIAAAARGLAARVEPGDQALAVTLTADAGADAAVVAGWMRAMPLRRSNRGRYDGRIIPAPDLQRLRDACAGAAVRILAFDCRGPEIEPLIEFVRQANIAQFTDRAFVDELVAWIRFSRREVAERHDGVTSAALGFPAIPRWLGRLIMTRFVKPDAEAARQERAIRGSSHLLLFVAAADDRRHWVEVGRCFQRVALTATALGIAHAHVNMPCEVVPIRRQLAAHLALHAGAQPLLLVRFGYGREPPAAPRRPIDAVIDRS